MLSSKLVVGLNKTSCILYEHTPGSLRVNGCTECFWSLWQDGSISTRYSLLRSLPLCVLQQLARQTGTKYHLGTAGQYNKLNPSLFTEVVE